MKIQTVVSSTFSILSISLPLHAEEITLISDSPAPNAVALVPTAGNGGSDLSTSEWTTVDSPPNATSWISGTTGVGYETSPTSGTSYATLLGLDLRAQMQNRSTTAYIRIPFTVERADLETTRALFLDMKYDDGFVAYLNGERVAAANAPVSLNASSSANSNNSDTNALQFERFDISSYTSLLNDGANVLAIHGLNDGTTSSDFLILPRLIATDSLPPVWPNLQIGTPITTASSPVALTHAPDGSNRVFIVERGGLIRIWDGGRLRTFLDLRSRVNTSNSGGDERGLLGLAFSPGYATDGHFYVNYISSNSSPRGATVISRFTVNPVNADDGIETSEQVLLEISQPEPNHNGGQINFGPDGFLYIGMGDGGGAGDVHGSTGNGQANDTFLGKMLRIDVEGTPDPGLPYAVPADNPFLLDPQVPDEIWAFGLRNPWRWSFDRKTGDMYIADVGQYEWEEVNFVPASSTGGENFQWRRIEGFNTFNAGTRIIKGTSTDPVFEYDHNAGSSITGGYVYRGLEHPRMQGIYFFGDYNSGTIWGLQKDSSGNWVNRQLLDTSLRISSFGEDEAGNLYVASLFTGAIHRLSDTRGVTYLRVTSASFTETGQAQIGFGSEIGKRYQLQFSTDLQSWSDVGRASRATGFASELTGTLPGVAPEQAYFRVVELAD